MGVAITFAADNPADVASADRLRLYTDAGLTNLAYDNTSGGPLSGGSYTFVFNGIAAGTYYPLVTVTYTDTTTGDIPLSPLVYPTPFTYSGDPASSPKDTVRFLLGDTDQTDPLLTDVEINFLVLQWPDSVYSAAAAGAEQIAGQFAREVTNQGDGVVVDFSMLQQKFMQLAAQLRTLAKRKGRLAVPYVGGQSITDKILALTDGDTEYTLFALGMHDDIRYAGSDVNSQRVNPLLSNQNYGGAAL